MRISDTLEKRLATLRFTQSVLQLCKLGDGLEVWRRADTRARCGANTATDSDDELTFALFQTLQTSREELPCLFYVSPLQVVFTEQGPDFGALPELFASPLVQLFRFLL